MLGFRQSPASTHPDRVMHDGWVLEGNTQLGSCSARNLGADLLRCRYNKVRGKQRWERLRVSHDNLAPVIAPARFGPPIRDTGPFLLRGRAHGVISVLP